MIGAILLAGAALACIIGINVWKTRRKNQLDAEKHKYYDIDGNEHPLGEITKHDVPSRSRMLNKKTPAPDYKVHEYYKETKKRGVSYEREKNKNKRS